MGQRKVRLRRDMEVASSSVVYPCGKGIAIDACDEDGLSFAHICHTIAMMKSMVADIQATIAEAEAGFTEHPKGHA